MNAKAATTKSTAAKPAKVAKPAKKAPAKKAPAKVKGAATAKPGAGASVAAKLSNEKLMSVLVGPHLSEKSSRLAEKLKQFVFKVRRDADKSEVKRAVELMFDVQVTAVQVVNCMGKAKRFGRSPGHRQDWKKAYVTLAEGQDINFLGAE
jgi:large subunit ribosomal protein L23